MTKIISLFNHKGGVSKTTTTFNLGWALAERGYKVLLVDADPQCNLTGTILGYSNNELDTYYKQNLRGNIHGALKPFFHGDLRPVDTANIVSALCDGLFLLPGHIDFSDFETQLSVALTTRDALPIMRNMPGALREIIVKTCSANSIDYALVDMSPSVGAINQCLLMGSDFFIVPTSPDFYCQQAIHSLARTLPKWNGDLERFRTADLTYPFQAPPKFLGIISQRYRPRDGNPARAFQQWIDRIKSDVDEILIPELFKNAMVIDRELFIEHVATGEPYNLANIADFNSLIAQSHVHNTPVFALTDAQINTQGVILETMRGNRDNFRQVFTDLAAAIACLTQ